MGNAIKVSNLTKLGFDGRPVLENLNVEVGDGEFVALVGPQANGKSTLLRLICGLDKPNSGSIKVLEKPVTGTDPKVGMIFQESLLYPWLKVYDNVTFGPLSRGVDKAQASKDATRWLGMLGLGKFGNKWPYELSGGMQRRAAIAAIMINNPAVLLSDELLGGLDWITRQVIADEFLRIWHETRPAVIYVTHMLEEAVYLSQRVILTTVRPAKVAETFEIKLPEKRWEIPNLRFSKDCAKYVARVRDRFEEEASKVAKRSS